MSVESDQKHLLRQIAKNIRDDIKYLKERRERCKRDPEMVKTLEKAIEGLKDALRIANKHLKRDDG